jgi:pimeloyl-ACP methyl ester carboxylesterase
MILLHGPGANATSWMRLLPALAGRYRLIVPDLPGHGDSIVQEGALDASHLVSWLNELITVTCPTPPILLGETIGGAIALAYAAQYSGRISRVIIADSMGLAPFEPEPAFGGALHGFFGEPNAETYQALWRQCVSDLDRVQRELGPRWSPFMSYNLESSRDPVRMEALGRLIAALAAQPIPEKDMARITVPVLMIWGRQDRAVPLAVGKAANRKYGWPLRVVDDAADAVALEQPEAMAKIVREFASE